LSHERGDGFRFGRCDHGVCEEITNLSELRRINALGLERAVLA